MREGIVDRGHKGESGQLADAWDGHELAAGRRGSCQYVSCRRRSRRPPSSLRFVPQQGPHGGRKTSHPLACFKGVIDEKGAKRRARGAAGSRTRLPSLGSDSFQGHLPGQPASRRRDDQRAERMSVQRLRMHWLEEKPVASRRQTSRVVAIDLVGRGRLERLVGPLALAMEMTAGPSWPQFVEQDRRHASSFEHDPTATRRFRQTVRHRPRRRIRSCSREPPRLRDRERR